MHHQRIQQIKKHNCLRCGRQFKPAKQTGAAGWILNLGRCKCDKPELSIYAEMEVDHHDGSSSSEATSSAGKLPSLDLPEQIDGRYEVLEQIGKGGMGAVFKVRDRELDQIFAIKTLHQNLARDSSLLKRFELEAEAISSLDHPGIVNVYRHGLTDDGEPYLVMDFAPGETLAELIEREGALPEQRALNILHQIAEAVMHAHDRGIIHRDIKPA
ncbi:MAG: serine/threonine protein kinase, partial [Cyanobacteria bacterium HKST-UBA02]|nr:serine/threonine protein kinase [Cyanobacteria bacterium HKST-UBA02]